MKCALFRSKKYTSNLSHGELRSGFLLWKSHWKAQPPTCTEFKHRVWMSGAGQGFVAQSSSQDWWGPVNFSTVLPVLHQAPSPSHSAFPEDAEFAVPMLEPHNVLNLFKHSEVPCAEICQENKDSFSLQLFEVNNSDRQCLHLHCQLAFIF